MAYTRIVKIERPVVSQGGELWRIWDKARLHEDWVEPTKYWQDLMGARMIGYFRATWSEDEGWKIKQRMAQQDW